MGMHQRLQIARALATWTRDGSVAALATVVHSSSSAPRGLGAQLAIAPEASRWTGGLSGGCAEVEVLDAARAVLAGNGPSALMLEMTRDDLGSAGPVCGATLTVIVERADRELAARYEDMVRLLVEGKPAKLTRAWSIDGPHERGISVIPGPAAVSTGDHENEGVHWGADSNQLQLEVSMRPAQRIIIGGSGDVAVDLVGQARRLGWRWVLADPRRAFLDASLELLGIAAGTRGLIAAEPAGCISDTWPQQMLDEVQTSSGDAVIACAHDSKLDMPLVAGAIAARAGYVGSIGSRVVQHQRREAIAELVGVIPDSYHGPAGLDLGGGDAAEIALSITSEILAVMNHRSGTPLRDLTTPIRAR